MTQSLDEILAEIKARAEKATPGPWKIGAPGIVYREENPEELELISITTVPVGIPAYQVREFMQNQEFITHTRTDVPRLVKALEIALDILKVNEEEAVIAEIGATLRGEEK